MHLDKAFAQIFATLYLRGPRQFDSLLIRIPGFESLCCLPLRRNKVQVEDSAAELSTVELLLIFADRSEQGFGPLPPIFIVNLIQIVDNEFDPRVHVEIWDDQCFLLHSGALLAPAIIALMTLQ